MTYFSKRLESCTFLYVLSLFPLTLKFGVITTTIFLEHCLPIHFTRYLLSTALSSFLSFVCVQ